MVRAVVLINTESEKTASAAEALAETPGVVEVYSVAGNYDLVAIISVPDNEDLADLVTLKIRKISGIERTQTLIAFRAYSKRELEGVLPMD